MRSSQNIDFPLSVWKQSHYSAKPLISFVSPQYDPRLEIRVRTLDSGRERKPQKRIFYVFFAFLLNYHFMTSILGYLKEVPSLVKSHRETVACLLFKTTIVLSELK